MRQWHPEEECRPSVCPWRRHSSRCRSESTLNFDKPSSHAHFPTWIPTAIPRVGHREKCHSHLPGVIAEHGLHKESFRGSSGHHQRRASTIASRHSSSSSCGDLLIKPPLTLSTISESEHMARSRDRFRLGGDVSQEEFSQEEEARIIVFHAALRPIDPKE